MSDREHYQITRLVDCQWKATPLQTTGAPGSPEEEVTQRLSKLIRASGFFKRLLQSPSPPVRRSAYTYMGLLSRR